MQSKSVILIAAWVLEGGKPPNKTSLWYCCINMASKWRDGGAQAASKVLHLRSKTQQCTPFKNPPN